MDEIEWKRCLERVDKNLKAKSTLKVNWKKRHWLQIKFVTICRWDRTMRKCNFYVYQRGKKTRVCNVGGRRLDVEKKHKIFSFQLFFSSIYTKRMWQKQMTLWLVCWCCPQLRHCRAMDKFHSVNRHQNDDYHIHWKWIQLMNCWWCQLLKEGNKKKGFLIENWIFHSLGWLACTQHGIHI